MVVCIAACGSAPIPSGQQTVASNSPSPALSAASSPTPNPTPSSAALPTTASSSSPTTAETPALEQTDVAVREIRAPHPNRVFGSGVWTGSEVIVWGGLEQSADGTGVVAAPAEGMAFDPGSLTWRDVVPASSGRRSNHLGTWTGEGMLVWGGFAAAQHDTQPPRGAAFNPSSNTWREIEPAPIRWGLPAAGVWTGSEWVIVVRHHDGVTRAAAYDPMSDTWRRLPDASLGVDRVELAWTGTELVLTDDYALFRMEPDGAEWLPASVPSDLQIQGGPMFWTGSKLITAVGVERDSPEEMAAWDPTTDSWARLAPAPRPPFGDAVWMDGRVGFFNGDLIYHVAADTGRTPLGLWSTNLTALAKVTYWSGRATASSPGEVGRPPRHLSSHTRPATCSRPTGSRPDQLLAATASISTRAPFGSALTAKVERAGGGLPTCFA